MIELLFLWAIEIWLFNLLFIPKYPDHEEDLPTLRDMAQQNAIPDQYVACEA